MTLTLGHHSLHPLGLLRRPSMFSPGPHRTAVTDDHSPIDERVFAVQRIGAVAVGGILLVFGLLGATSGVGFLVTHGQRHLGLSSNGLLSTLSLIVAVVLLGAALRGPRPASTVMIVLGVLFLLSALGNMAVLNTPFNLLAFRMSNVIFSVVVGLLMLFLGAYGRLSGNLPADSPYAHPHALAEEPDDLPSTPEQYAAEAAMREAEIAVVQHYATAEQLRRVRAMSGAHTREDRRRVWMEYDASQV
jgi:uncharacterized protein DUF4383